MRPAVDFNHVTDVDVMVRAAALLLRVLRLDIINFESLKRVSWRLTRDIVLCP